MLVLAAELRTPATGFGSGQFLYPTRGDFSNTLRLKVALVGYGPTAPVQRLRLLWMGSANYSCGQPIPANNGGWDSGVPAQNPVLLPPPLPYSIPSQSMSDVEMTGDISY